MEYIQAALLAFALYITSVAVCRFIDYVVAKVTGNVTFHFMSAALAISAYWHLT